MSSPVASTPVAPDECLGDGKQGRRRRRIYGSLAREVGGSGVTVNVLVVKAIDIEHLRETEPSDKNRSWTTPEEIVDAMVYLSSDASAAINGARIPLHHRD